MSELDEKRAEALRLVRAGEVVLGEIAERLDIQPALLMEWISTEAWKRHGYSPALAEARARSEHLAPRHPDTTQTFAAIVHDIFMPPLKTSGFRKARNVWTRQCDKVRTTVDIQRAWSTGDLLRFTSNWAIGVSGFQLPFQGGETVLSGRIGRFLGNGHDAWWSIQLGWLAQESRLVLEDSDQCRHDLAEGLERMIGWLDPIHTIPDLIALMERDDPHLHLDPFERRTLPETIATLRRLDETSHRPG
jgi:hypothetical protein